jgi:hypothetical protein
VTLKVIGRALDHDRFGRCEKRSAAGQFDASRYKRFATLALLDPRGTDQRYLDRHQAWAIVPASLREDDLIDLVWGAAAYRRIQQSDST